MKTYARIFSLGICLTLWIVMGSGTSALAKNTKKIPPGLAKKQSLPPGQAKKLQDTQGLPPGLAKKYNLPSLNAQARHQQTWCLDHDGQVNVVLVDNSICGCVTETHAVEFVTEANWTEALGSVLYHALATNKQPGLVLFRDEEEYPAYLAQLNAVTKYFELPITFWTIDLEEDDEQENETEED